MGSDEGEKDRTLWCVHGTISVVLICLSRAEFWELEDGAQKILSKEGELDEFKLHQSKEILMTFFHPDVLFALLLFLFFVETNVVPEALCPPDTTNEHEEDCKVDLSDKKIRLELKPLANVCPNIIFFLIL